MESDVVSMPKMKGLIEEAKELLTIFVASRSTARDRRS